MGVLGPGTLPIGNGEPAMASTHFRADLSKLRYHSRRCHDKHSLNGYSCRQAPFSNLARPVLPHAGCIPWCWPLY